MHIQSSHYANQQTGQQPTDQRVLEHYPGNFAGGDSPENVMGGQAEPGVGGCIEEVEKHGNDNARQLNVLYLVNLRKKKGYSKLTLSLLADKVDKYKMMAMNKANAKLK